MIVVLLVLGEGGDGGGPTSRVSRVLMTGPLVPFADAYSAELRERGYSRLSIVNELRQVGRLSRWLEAEGLSVADLSDGRIEQFLAWQRAGGRHRCQWSRPGLLCLLEVLRGLEVLAAEDAAAAGSPADLLLASFERYLLAERGLAAGTVSGYVRHARRFLDGLRGGRRAGRVGGERCDRRGAARGRVGVVGQRGAVLRVRAARVSAVLLHRGAGGGRSLAGGAGGDRPAARSRCRRRSAGRMPRRCSVAVTGAERSGGATTR